MPEGESFLMRPVEAGYIPYTALKDGQSTWLILPA
jgi:hypothetical protein